MSKPPDVFRHRRRQWKGKDAERCGRPVRPDLGHAVNNCMTVIVNDGALIKGSRPPYRKGAETLFQYIRDRLHWSVLCLCAAPQGSIK